MNELESTTRKKIRYKATTSSGNPRGGCNLLIFRLFLLYAFYPFIAFVLVAFNKLLGGFFRLLAVMAFTYKIICIIIVFRYMFDELCGDGIDIMCSRTLHVD